MPLPYRPPVPVDALAAALPEAFLLLHFLCLGRVEPLAETPVPNGLPEPLESLPDPFCVEPFEPLTVGAFCSGLATLADVATVAACVTVMVY